MVWLLKSGVAVNVASVQGMGAKPELTKKYGSPHWLGRSVNSSSAPAIGEESTAVHPASSAPVLRRKLNSFQRSMLQWNSMHPYNAVHVVRIPGALEPARLRRAINEVLSLASLSALKLDPGHGAYDCLGGPAAYEPSFLPTETCSMPLLVAEIERQLNTQFVQSGPFQPFRFFVAPEESYFLLGLAYLHAVADAVAVVLLLRQITEAYHGRKMLNAASEFHSKLSARRRQGSDAGILLRKLAAYPSFMRDLRSSYRPHYRSSLDLRNRFSLFKVNASQMRALVKISKSLAVTVNDVLLALLFESLSHLAPGRIKEKRRRKLSIGCIVNTRKDFDSGSEHSTGLFLGSFVLTHEVPERICLADLVRDVARKTRQIKMQKLYLGTGLELAFGRFMLSFYSTERRKKLYQKHYPLWGGLTNMNVNTLWPAETNTEPMEYIRAVSTGPVTPLVLSFTTSGDSAHLGLSYRATVFSAEDIEKFASHFLHHLSEPEVKT